MGKNKFTVKDIAVKTNTSPATVSRVLNNSGYPVSLELKEKILNTASEMGYSFKKTRIHKVEDSKDICVILPNLSNQYYVILLQGIEEVASKYNYNLLLCNSSRLPNKEKKFIEGLLEKNIKGIIIISINSDTDALLNYKNMGNNIVCLEQDINIECSKIGFDYYKSGYLAAEYLRGLGHKKIAFLSSPISYFSRRELKRGFIEGMRVTGISEDNILIFTAEEEEEMADIIYESKNGSEQVQRLLTLKKSEMPTAIFCSNDMTAISAIHELTRNGIRVPEDISVMGFDNIPISQMITPMLTTIDQFSRDLGTMACETLIKKMKGEIQTDISMIFEPKIIERESTAKFSDKKLN
jgi:LacI family transcriptional regulator